MYTAQITKERIKKMCKTSIEQMLTDCSLGTNAVRQINDNKGMASFSLAKIADYLECSVDYLLGRTDNPTSHITQAGSTVNNAPISGNFNSIGNSGSISVSTTEHMLDENEKALLEYYNSLSPVDRAQLLLDVAKMSKKDKDT